MSSRESGIQSASGIAIRAKYGSGSWVRVKHGSAYSTVGDPDLYGCVWGCMFGMEVKNDAGRLTKIQQFRLREMEKAGAIVGGVRSPEEALAILDRGLAHLERPDTKR